MDIMQHNVIQTIDEVSNSISTSMQCESQFVHFESSSPLFSRQVHIECTLRKRPINVSETTTWNLSEGGKGKKEDR